MRIAPGIFPHRRSVTARTSDAHAETPDALAWCLLPKIRTLTRASMLAAAATVTLITGCGSIPDLKPFAEQTQELDTSVRSAFGAVAGVMDATAASERMKNDAGVGSRSDTWQSTSTEFRKQAAVRARVLAAFAAYSDRLSAIADDARQTDKDIDEVAGAVKSLVGEVDNAIKLPGAGAMTEVAKFLADFLAAAAKEIDRIRTARTLGEAIDKADEIVGTLAKKLVADMNDLRTSVDAMIPGGDSVEANHIRQAEGQGDLLRARMVMLDERRIAAERLREAIHGRELALRAMPDLEEQARTAANEEAKANALVKLQNMQEHAGRNRDAAETAMKQFEAASAQLPAIERAIAAIDARTAAADARVAAARGVIASTSDAITEWAAAHEQLKTAVAQSRRVTLAGLKSAVARVREYRDRLIELEKKLDELQKAKAGG